MSDIEKQLAAIRYTADRTKRYNEHGFTLLQLGIRGVVYFNTREDVADALTGLMDFYYEWAKDKLTIAWHEKGHRDIKGNAKRACKYQCILLFQYHLYCCRFGK